MTEFVDIVNENNKVIGQATREACHRDPKLLHRTVHFTLMDVTDTTFAVSIRNPALKYDGGKLCFMGEHVIAGESQAAAASRGILEELGVRVSNPRLLGEHIFAYDKQRELVQFYLGMIMNKQVTPDKAEITGIMWFGISDLLTHLNEYSDMMAYWMRHIDFAHLKDA